jgi:hypothetical protein
MDLKNYKLKTPTKKFNHDWEVWADELTAYFKRNCYWLFHRYDKHKIINAYKYCKEKGIDKINYLLGMLNKN